MRRRRCESYERVSALAYGVQSSEKALAGLSSIREERGGFSWRTFHPDPGRSLSSFIERVFADAGNDHEQPSEALSQLPPLSMMGLSVRSKCI
jgi:hypothetical protein